MAMPRSPESVPRRKLGHSGIEVSALGLGCMSLSGTYGKSDDPTSIALIHRALDLGVSFLDSSDMYGWGHNEELLGQALRGRRGRAVLATKFGQVQSPGGANLVNGRPAHVVAACDESLPRLGSTRSTSTTSTGSTRRCRSRRPSAPWPAGRARARCGRSGCPRRRRRRSAAPTRSTRSAPCRSSTRCSTAARRGDLPRSAGSSGSRFVAYSPLGRGFLSGRSRAPAEIPEDDRKRQHPRFQGENFEHNRRLVARIEAIAAAQGHHGRPAGARLAARPGDDVVPIPGTKRVAYLEENLGALGVRLSAADLEQIDEAMPPGAARGSRYPEAQMKGVYL